MKYFIHVCFIVVLVGCKKSTTKNNYVDNDRLVAYKVEGLRDILLNTDINSQLLPLTIAYNNREQRRVELSVTGLPEGITMNNDFINSGYPTFKTSLTFYDTSYLAPAAIGEHAVMLSVKSEGGDRKDFPFKIIINKPDTCADRFTGAFPTCYDQLNTLLYSDSVYQDTAVTNRIWFTNLANSGQTVMGMVTNCRICIPAQVVGGISFSGGGKQTTIASGNKIDLNVKVGNNYYLLYMK